MDYCGNVIYENGVQKLLLTEEGYVTLEVLYFSLINPQTALVFCSNKTTFLNTTETVQIRTNGYIDIYDVDQQNTSGDSFRNFATKMCNAFAGKGIEFNI